jgi:hypothetical protein
MRTYRWKTAAIGAALVACAGGAGAQDVSDPHAGHLAPAASHEQHERHEEDQQHDIGSMAREGSGTSWQPDLTPMYAFHASSRGWTLMAHGNAFLQYLHESGARGADQAGSINWVMGMATRQAGAGRLQLRGMVSVEPWTIAGCGYPDLLASGELCDGQPIHDRQHPHDLFMELSARYDAPLARGLRWQVYGGPAGEPALGPVAFPHRLSAVPNPIAPIAHHWLDATHVTYGVATAGIYGPRWKVETSAFNGREPDEHRGGFDFAAMDSVSGRVWFLPAPGVALQVSTGRLAEAEAAAPGGDRATVTRTTASATVHAGAAGGSIWATTVAWGRNAHEGHATHAVLIETNVTRRERDAFFGRFEIAAKTAHDLGLADDDGNLTVAKLQGGYTRYLAPRRGFAPGFGGGMSFGVVPASLETAYRRRVGVGVAIFVTVRPSGKM